MKIHSRTLEIFELLSKGYFICSNSVDDEHRKLYNIIEEEFEDLHAYFEPIGFELERGQEYFYFSRRESRADIERKIEQAYRWIDILDFFKAFNSGFGVGYRFSPADILVQVKIDANLKDKLDQLKKPLGEGNQQERVQRLVDDLVRYGFVALESEVTQQYKVLSSYHYIEQLIMSIHITEEVENAVS
jgi:hypothetical protein